MVDLVVQIDLGLEPPCQPPTLGCLRDHHLADPAQHGAGNLEVDRALPSKFAAGSSKCR